MSALRQLILSLLVACGVGWLWYSYFPGARDFVQKQDLYKALAPGAETRPADGGAKLAAAPAGGRGSGGRGARTQLVVVKPAVTEVLNARVSALGTGVALHSVTVMPADSGRLTEVLISAGQKVKAGDLLVRLESASEQIAYDKAKVAYDDAKRTLDRSEQLVKANSISATQMQQAQLAADTAELTMRSAEVDLKNRTVLAPIAGTVGIVQVNLGNEVTAQTVIATIEDDSAILVNYWLPETLVGAVHPGDPVQAVPVARPGQVIEAQVVAIDNRVDAASGTYEVQARLPNPDGSLRPGMSFSVAMSLPGDSYIAVDPLAIQWGAGGAYVWRVTDDAASKVPVRIVQRNTETVLVVGALAAGDQIATEGLDGLRAGAKVQVAGAAEPVANAGGGAPPASGN